MAEISLNKQLIRPLLMQMRESASMGQEVGLMETCIMHERLLLAQSDDRAELLNALGDICSMRHRSREIHHLNHAIVIHEDALRVSSNDQKILHSSSLGLCLFHRFEQLGKIIDLDRSVEVQNQAVIHASDNHLGKPFLLDLLGISLLRCFENLGDIADLNKSIRVKEDAVRIAPEMITPANQHF